MSEHAISSLQTAPPLVTLRNAPAQPFDGAIAAARTCYSPRVVAAAEVTDRQRDSIGALTFDAGHHTVYQHAHFEFGLENISRQLVWTSLHAYPFYNSEQSSQRYVKLRDPRAFVPPIAGEALAVYERAILSAWDSYAELSALLKDDAFRILKELRYVTPRASAERLKGIEKEAEKKAIETARYVIPLAAFTSMVHTVSGITLHRLRRMAAAGDAPYEARQVIGRMVDLVRSADPVLLREGWLRRAAGRGAARGVLPQGARRRRRLRPGLRREAERTRVAARGLLAGRRGAVADAVRTTFGLTAEDMSDDEAIDRVLNPARNRYRLEVMNVSYHSPLMRALNHPSYTFEKRLSHTADSQDQRHRMVPASRPLMLYVDTVAPDYVTPRLIAANPEARAAYDRAMRAAWEAKNRLLELEVPLEFAMYVLPNAKALRMVESGPLHRAVCTSG